VTDAPTGPVGYCETGKRRVASERQYRRVMLEKCRQPVERAGGALDAARAGRELRSAETAV
jgi:hypothetical protein